MIHKVGLLPKDNFQQVPFAYKMFKRADHVGWEQSTEFKKAFSVDVDIEFVGVWYEYIITYIRETHNPKLGIPSTRWASSPKDYPSQPQTPSSEHSDTPSRWTNGAQSLKRIYGTGPMRMN
jgi:hypothetical protein